MKHRHHPRVIVKALAVQNSAPTIWVTAIALTMLYTLMVL